MLRSRRTNPFYLPYQRFLEELEAVARRSRRTMAARFPGRDRARRARAGGLSVASDRDPMLSVDHSSGEVGFADELLDKLAAKIREGAGS